MRGSQEQHRLSITCCCLPAMSVDLARFHFELLFLRILENKCEVVIIYNKHARHILFFVTDCKKVVLNIIYTERNEKINPIT